MNERKRNYRQQLKKSNLHKFICWINKSQADPYEIENNI
jgi:hypothetical protein